MHLYWFEAVATYATAESPFEDETKSDESTFKLLGSAFYGFVTFVLIIVALLWGAQWETVGMLYILYIFPSLVASALGYSRA